MAALRFLGLAFRIVRKQTSFNVQRIYEGRQYVRRFEVTRETRHITDHLWTWLLVDFSRRRPAAIMDFQNVISFNSH